MPMETKDIKARIMALGKDFSNKKTRDELRSLIGEYLHGSKGDTDSM